MSSRISGAIVQNIILTLINSIESMKRCLANRTLFAEKVTRFSQEVHS